MIGLQSWPKPILLGRGSWPDAGRSDRWRPADRDCRSASLSDEEAGGELVSNMTPRARRSQPFDSKLWEHPKMCPLDDEGDGVMM